MEKQCKELTSIYLIHQFSLGISHRITKIKLSLRIHIKKEINIKEIAGKVIPLKSKQKKRKPGKCMK